MNSFQILQRLRGMLSRKGFNEDDLATIREAIQHIEINDEEIFKLREDITNTDFSYED